MQLVPRPLQRMLIAAGMIISWCGALLKRPEVSVRGIALSSLSLSELALDVRFLVNNPNSFKIPLKSLSFDVFYEDGSNLVPLSHGEKSGIRIEPGGNEIIVPVTIKNAELLRSLAGLITRGEVTLRIGGTASPDFYGIAPDVPFTYVTTIAR
jgi:LEA14-like dessication related protein